MDEAQLLQKLREAFRIEAAERLESLSTGLIHLESFPAPDSDVLEAVFRDAHSLKGAARAVNLLEIESLCQAMEGVFSGLKQGEVGLSPPLFDVMYRSVRLMENYLAGGEKKALEEIDRLVSRLNTLRQEKTPSGEPAPAPPKAEPPPASAAAVDAEPSVPRIRSSPDTVRISTAKLDALLQKAEELVSLKLAASLHVSRLRELANTLEDWEKHWLKARPLMRQFPSLSDFLSRHQDRLQSAARTTGSLAKGAEGDRRILVAMVDDLLEGMKEATMLPFSTLLDGFPRMVREISREQQKQVHLELCGAEIEIDRRILEEIKDPLIHLLRNAVDHGIEEPGRRIEAGKPALGTITLAVTQPEGNRILVTLSDDGGGIDLPRLRASAVRLGILSEAEAAALEEKQAIELIFHSGLSSRGEVSRLSGRGLGMAIVREKIEKLSGLITVETRPQQGALFHVELPVTLSTFRGVFVRLADAFFIIPTTHVDRVLRVAEEQIRTVENRETITLEKRILPLLDLSQVMRISRRSPPGKNGHRYAVVLGSGDGRVAFEVDEIVNEQEILVKSLGKQLVRVPCITGATILGNGRVVPIVNVNDLLKASRSAVGPPAHKAVVQEREARQKAILVVEDSITSRVLLKNILEASGYRVKTAVDGREGFTRLKTEAFDLVVSDVEMPEINGFELTKRIREDKALCEMPVVLVTSLDSPADKERGIDAGADAYIVKSAFDQSNLLETVARLI